MKLFVHIGTHKTGTTSVQAFLREHAYALAQDGLYVPTSGTLDKRSGHHNVGWGLRGDPRFSPARGGLRDLITELARSPAPAAVISSEDLEYLADQPATLALFEQALVDAGHEPRYILFVRRPDAYAVSLYTELHKHGLAMPFRDFVWQVLRTGKFVMRGDWSFHFDTYKFARKWCQSARAPLYIYGYDAAVAAQGILPTFLFLIGSSDDLICLSHSAERFNQGKPAKIPVLESAIAGWLLRQRFREQMNTLAAPLLVRPEQDVVSTAAAFPASEAEEFPATRGERSRSRSAPSRAP